MAYNNRNSNNQGNNYQGNNYQGNNYQDKPQFKKSGAKYTIIRKGNFVDGTIINAWNSSKSKGLILVKVAPYNKSDELVESANGNQYMKMIATVDYRRSGQTKVIPCLMNLKTQVVVLKELGMVITPKGSGRTASGKTATGYFGTFIKN